MRFEPSIYLDALMRDVIAFGGRIVVRAFASPRDLATLDESLIVNCTGLGPGSRTVTSRLVVVGQHQCVDRSGSGANPGAGCDPAKTDRCRVRLHAP